MNTAIKEDYVSFELAKLLKEKGFNNELEVTSKWYLKYKGEYMLVSMGSAEHKEDSIDVPTLQMAAKWLRKNFNMDPVPYATSIGWYFEVFDLTQRDITGCALLYDAGIPSKEKMLETYEEALESAIKYCLENLI